MDASADGGTHGFLFADLRGYARIVDTRGAVEASRLLERYRRIVRDVVARDGGAEIKTEGDSFYVVLPSASAALRCGLDILAACREPDDGGEAIAVGIGIHAGESVAHEGGFVGSAVNIAARICAVAGVGELLASGTIRELTRSIVAARFTPLGRRKLKGVAEPIELFRVLPDGTPPAIAIRARVTVTGRTRLIGVSLAAVVVLVAAVLAIDLARRGAAPPAGPAAAASSSAPSEGQAASATAPPFPPVTMRTRVLPPGTYRPSFNRDVASVRLDDAGWTLVGDSADVLVLGHWTVVTPGIVEDIAYGGLLRISVVYTGPCPGDATRILGDRPQDLIEWVQSTPQLTASDPRTVLDLGRNGIGIRATVKPPPAGGCGIGDPKSVRLFGIGNSEWSPSEGTRLAFEALDDGGRTLTVLFAGPSDAVLDRFETSFGRRLVSAIVLNH